jgi:dTDP-4-dehydrorhamnose 3,5-epimerase
MIFLKTALEDAHLIELERRRDDRGFFARTMCLNEFAERGMACEFVQQNMSVTVKAGTIRGMHFQHPPFSEAKLVRCIRGQILDVIVDLRPGSPTYMRWQGFLLSADNGHQIYVPPGYAHGFQSLVDDIEVSYLVTAPYTPGAEGGLRYDDPHLAIDWPLPATSVSDRDMAWPMIHAHALPAL